MSDTKHSDTMDTLDDPIVDLNYGIAGHMPTSPTSPDSPEMAGATMVAPGHSEDSGVKFAVEVMDDTAPQSTSSSTATTLAVGNTQTTGNTQSTGNLQSAGMTQSGGNMQVAGNNMIGQGFAPGTVFHLFPLLPAELQINVFRFAMRRAGIHWFGIQVRFAPGGDDMFLDVKAVPQSITKQWRMIGSVCPIAANAVNIALTRRNAKHVLQNRYQKRHPVNRKHDLVVFEFRPTGSHHDTWISRLSLIDVPLTEARLGRGLEKVGVKWSSYPPVHMNSWGLICPGHHYPNNLQHGQEGPATRPRNYRCGLVCMDALQTFVTMFHNLKTFYLLVLVRKRDVRRPQIVDKKYETFGQPYRGMAASLMCVCRNCGSSNQDRLADNNCRACGKNGWEEECAHLCKVHRENPDLYIYEDMKRNYYEIPWDLVFVWVQDYKELVNLALSARQSYEAAIRNGQIVRPADLPEVPEFRVLVSCYTTTEFPPEMRV